jgi:hypothetical protein
MPKAAMVSEQPFQIAQSRWQQHAARKTKLSVFHYQLFMSLRYKFLNNTGLSVQGSFDDCSWSVSVPLHLVRSP